MPDVSRKPMHSAPPMIMLAFGLETQTTRIPIDKPRVKANRRKDFLSGLVYSIFYKCSKVRFGQFKLGHLPWM